MAGVRYGICRKHRSSSLHYRGTTSVTCETGIGFRKGVLRMRVVISPSPPTYPPRLLVACTQYSYQWIFTVLKNATSIRNLLHAQIFYTNATFGRHRQILFNLSAYFELYLMVMNQYSNFLIDLLNMKHSFPLFSDIKDGDWRTLSPHHMSISVLCSKAPRSLN